MKNKNKQLSIFSLFTVALTLVSVMLSFFSAFAAEEQPTGEESMILQQDQSTDSSAVSSSEPSQQEITSISIEISSESETSHTASSSEEQELAIENSPISNDFDNYSIVPAASGDIASSTVPKYPVTYGSTVGTAIYNEIGQFNLRLIGNSNTLGYDRGRALSRPYYEYVDTDNDPTTYNSSSMDYIGEGRVEKAFLYIAQSYEVTGLQNATRANAFILGPRGNKFYFDQGYQDAYYDITEFIQQEGNGTYWGKNIDSERVQNVNRDNFANWEILIVEENLDLPYRNVVVNGFHLRMQNATNTLKTSLSSVTMSPSNITGQTVLSSAGGNASLFSGSAYINSMKSGSQIGQTQLPSGVRGTDLLQGRITINGVDDLQRNPTDIPGNIDLLTQDLGVGSIKDGSDNIGFQLTTASDIVFLHMFGLAVDVGIPDIKIESYIHTAGNSSAYFTMGDSIEIGNTITANPLEDKFYLNSAVVTIQLPTGASYIANSASSEDNPVINEVYSTDTRELKLYFENTITNNTFDFTYKIQSSDGVKISNIETTLNGFNATLNLVTDLLLTFRSNTISLYPSYPVIVNHINERTGEYLSQETLEGLYNTNFATSTSTFTGFSFNPNANNSPLTGIFSDSLQTIQLYYSPNTYVLTFNPNNGTDLLPETQNLVFGTLADPVSAPTRNGYTFEGWNTAPSGPGTFWNFATDTMPAKSFTLYARWSANIYNLSFDLNGGAGNAPSSQNLAYGALATPVSTPARSGYTFKGWNTLSDGSGTFWNFTTSTMPANNVNLIAIWDQVPVSSVPSSSNSSSSSSANSSSSIASSSSFARASASTISSSSRVSSNSISSSTTVSVSSNSTQNPVSSEVTSPIENKPQERYLTIQEETLEKIDESGTPIINIGDFKLPLYANTRLFVWSLFNLLVTIFSVVVSVIIGINLIRKRRKSGNDKASKMNWVALLSGICAIILFILTANLFGIMVLFDSLSILYAIFAIIEIIAILFMSTKRKQIVDKE